MKVNCLPKEGRRLVMTIYVDDEPWRDVHTKIFGRQLSIPYYDTLEAFQEAFHAMEYAKAKKYAFNCLAMRSYPSTQLKRLLERNLISAEVIQKILQECKRLGYLNDEEWLERFIKGQLARHAGPQVVIAKLMNKGISREVAQKYIDRHSGDDQGRESISHLLKTKYKNRDFSDFREKQKVFAALVRKGFDIEMIKSELDRKDAN